VEAAGKEDKAVEAKGATPAVGWVWKVIHLLTSLPTPGINTHK
jgi:hypothetical protein